jgi:hypothetical protein
MNDPYSRSIPYSIRKLPPGPERDEALRQHQAAKVADQIVAAAAPAFQPRNRTGRGDLGKVAFEAKGKPWYVDDINSDDSPSAWRSPHCERWVSRVWHRNGPAFVVVLVGNYVKWPPRRGEGKGRTRYFPSAALAAVHAMELEEQ